MSAEESLMVGDAGGGLPGAERVRIGLVATDALRVLGLQTILGETYELLPLSAPGALDAGRVELALLDATSTTHLFEMLASFRQLRPAIRVIVLGSETEHSYIERVIGSGAKGYLSHAANEEELRMALDVVRDGSIWAPRKVLAHLLERRPAPDRSAEEESVRFTQREVEVLRLLVMGHPNREIALALGVDEGTVKAHLGRLMRKAHVDNRTALSMRALELGWTNTDR